MATKKQKQELIDTLKFTPIKVTLMLQGYGGECYAGKVDRKDYEFFKSKKIDIEEYASDWDGEFNERVPAEFQPFPPGSPYECDGLFHASGAELSELNYVTVTDEHGNEIWEHNLSYSELEDAGVTVQESGGEDLDDLDEGEVVFWGGQGEKGCFFDAEFTLTQPFDPKKLVIHYENCDGWYIINWVEYDGEELDGTGGYSTTGKWAESKWRLGGDEEVYESVSVEDQDEDEETPESACTSEQRDTDAEFDWSPSPDYECVQCEWKGTVDEANYDADDNLICPECGESIEQIELQDNTDWNPIAELEKIIPPYTVTDWFEKDVNPVHKGEYEVVYDAAWPLSGQGRAEWTGRSWKQNGEKLAILKWRGITKDMGN